MARSGGREKEREGEEGERERGREKDALTCRSGNEIEPTQLARRRVKGGRQSRQAATIERESEKLVNPINQ